jgi:threonine synthase
MRARNMIGQEELVVCNLTGHGLKQPEAIRLRDEDLCPIQPTLAALREQVRKADEGE